MHSKTVGFVGCGNMGEAILSGILKEEVVLPANIRVCTRSTNSANRLCLKYLVHQDSAEGIASSCDIILICVKPYLVPGVLTQMKDTLNESSLIISVAAGVKIATMAACLGSGAKIIRAMPNVAASICSSVTSLSFSETISSSDAALAELLFRSIGSVFVVPESLIHGVIGVSGSSPAYVFLFLEALSDGAVHAGIPRAQSYEMAAQAVIGAAKLVLSSGKAPGELKDMVCSPGGTTIEAVRYLEKEGFRSAVIEAMLKCIEKSKQMEFGSHTN